MALEPHGSRSSVVKDYAIKTTMNEGPCRPEVHKVLPVGPSVAPCKTALSAVDKKMLKQFKRFKQVQKGCKGFKRASTFQKVSKVREVKKSSRV